ncbi:outer-membrane lipoprotein carrier protein [Escherichia coli]|nr:outer-membrane lipoprotein carrier protein [Escherichia coli]
MKKIAITCALLSSLVASSVWADAASDLKSRLDKVSSFHASFTQKVTDGSGAAVQEGQGRSVGETSKLIQLAYDST